MCFANHQSLGHTAPVRDKANCRDGTVLLTKASLGSKMPSERSVPDSAQSECGQAGVISLHSEIMAYICLLCSVRFFFFPSVAFSALARS